MILVETLVSSCGSDDNNGLAVTNQNLLGKWYLKGGTTDNGAIENYGHDCPTSKDYQEFLVTGILNFQGYDASCNMQHVESSSWSLNGNVITVVNANFDQVSYNYEYIVEKLTPTTLILK